MRVGAAAVLVLPLLFGIAAAQCPPAGSVLFEQRFDDLPLTTTSINDIEGNVWSPTPPNGWLVSTSQSMKEGRSEFQGWTFWDSEAWIQAAGNSGRGNFGLVHGVVAVADIQAWKATTQPYSSSTEHFFATLASPETALPAGCTEPLSLNFDYSYYRYSSEVTTVYADWYDASGNVVETVTLMQLTSTQSNSRADIEVAPKSSLLRVRFESSMGSYSYNGYWWAIDNLVLRVPADRQTCAQEGVATWIGGDGTWTNPSNWCDERVPGATDNVILSCGLSQCHIDVNAAVEVSSIRLADGAQGEIFLTVNQPLTVHDSCVVQHFDLNSNFLGYTNTMEVQGDFMWRGGNINAEIIVRGDFSTASGYYYRTFSLGDGAHLALEPRQATNYTIFWDPAWFPRTSSTSARLTVGALANVFIYVTEQRQADMHVEVYGTLKTSYGLRFLGLMLNDGSVFHMAPTDSVATRFGSYTFCRDGATIVAPPAPHAGWPVPELQIEGTAHFDPGCRLEGAMRLYHTGGTSTFAAEVHEIVNVTMAGGSLGFVGHDLVSSIKHVRLNGGTLHFSDAEKGPALDELIVWGGDVHFHGPSSTVNCTLRSTLVVYDQFRITHTFSWLSGYLRGAVGINSRVDVGTGMTMRTSGTMYLYAVQLTLPAAAITDYTNGDIYVRHGAQIIVPEDATLRITMAEQTLYQTTSEVSGNSAGTLVNHGRVEFRHKYALSYITLVVAIVNYGYMVVTGGMATFSGPVTHLGVLEVAQAAMLSFQNGGSRACRSDCEGWKVLATGSKLTGSGVIEVRDYLPLTVSASSVSPKLRWSVVSGGLDFDVGIPLSFGTVEFSSGTMRAVRAATLSFKVLRLRGGTMDLESATWRASLLSQTGGTLVVRNTATIDQLEWLGGTWSGDGDATIQVKSGVVCGTSTHYLDALTVSVLGKVVWQDEGSIYSSNGAQWVIAAGGSFEVRRAFLTWSAGTESHEFTIINRGTLLFAPAQALQGTITINVGVRNEGRIEASGGTVIFSGTVASDSVTLLSSTATLLLSGSAPKVFGPLATIGGIPGAGLGTLHVASPLQVHAKRVDLKAFIVNIPSSSYTAVISSSVLRCNMDRLEALRGVLYLNTRNGAVSVRTVRVEGAEVRLNTYLDVESLDMRSGTLDVGVLLRVVGDIAWYGGTLRGTGYSDVEGFLRLFSGNTKTLERLYIRMNGGMEVDSPGTLTYNYGARIDLNEGSTSTFGGTGFSMTGTGRLVNIGNLTMTLDRGSDATDASVKVAVDMENRGRIHLDNGDLEAQRFFVSTGYVHTAPGSGLRLTADATFAPGSTLRGGGRVVTSGATLGVSADVFEAASLELSGGITNIDPSVDLTGLASVLLLSNAKLLVTRDELAFNNLTIISGTCEVNAGTFDLEHLSLVAGSFNLYGTGRIGTSFSWESGTLGGGLGPLRIEANSVVLNPTAAITLRREIHITSRLRISGENRLNLPAEAKLRILQGAHLELAEAAVITIDGNGPVIVEGTASLPADSCPERVDIDNLRLETGGALEVACGQLRLGRLVSAPNATISLLEGSELHMQQSTTVHASIAGGGTLTATGGRIVLPRTASHSLRAIRVENRASLLLQRYIPGLENVTVQQGDIYLSGGAVASDGSDRGRITLGIVDITDGGVYIAPDAELSDVILRATGSLLEIGNDVTVDRLNFQAGRVTTPRAGRLTLLSDSMFDTAVNKIFDSVQLHNNGTLAILDETGTSAVSTYFRNGAGMVNHGTLLLKSTARLYGDTDNAYASTALLNAGDIICSRDDAAGEADIDCYSSLALVMMAGSSLTVEQGAWRQARALLMQGDGVSMHADAASGIEIFTDVTVSPGALVDVGRLTFRTDDSLLLPGLYAGTWDVRRFEVYVGSSARVYLRLQSPDIRVATIVLGSGGLNIAANATGHVPTLEMGRATSYRYLTFVDGGTLENLALYSTYDRLSTFGPLVVRNRFTWESGYIYAYGDGDFTFQGQTEIATPQAHYVYGDRANVRVTGTMRLNRESSLQFNSAAQLLVQGTLELEDNAYINGASAAAVVNRGTLRMRDGASASINVNFVQEGTMNIIGDRLTLTKGVVLNAPVNSTGALGLASSWLHLDPSVDFSETLVDLYMPTTETFVTGPRSVRVRDIYLGSSQYNLRVTNKDVTGADAPPLCIDNARVLTYADLTLNVPLVADSFVLQRGDLYLNAPLTVTGNLVLIDPRAPQGSAPLIVHGTVSSAAHLELPAGTNLLQNGDCSQSTNFWARDGYWYCSGNIYGSAFYIYRLTTNTKTGWVAQTVTLASPSDGATPMRMEAFVSPYSSSEAYYAGVEAEALDASDAVLKVLFNITKTGGGWQRLGETVTPPAGTVKVRFAMRSERYTHFDHAFVGVAEEPAYDAALNYTLHRYAATDTNGALEVRSTEGNPCAVYDASCSACTGAAGCGWSTTAARCLPGDAAGPLLGHACGWATAPDACPAACADRTTDDACEAEGRKSRCVWCPTSGCKPLQTNACDGDATLIWTGAGTNNRLETAENWAPARTPTETDTLLIAASSYLTVDTGSTTTPLRVQALHITSHGGHVTLRLSRPLELAGPVKSSFGEHSTLYFGGRYGRLENTQPLVIQGNVGGNYYFDFRGAGAVTVEGRFDLRSNNQRLYLYEKTLTLAGGSEWGSGYYNYIRSGGLLVLDAGAVHLFTYHTRFYDGPVRIRGTAIFDYQSGTADIYFYKRLINDGHMRLENAWVRVYEGGDYSGRFTVSESGRLELYGGGSASTNAHTFASTARVDGPGALRINTNGAVAFQAGALMSARAFEGYAGVMELSAAVVGGSVGLLDIRGSGFTLTLNGGVELPVRRLIVINGRLNLDVPITVADQFHLHGGTIAGSANMTVLSAGTSTVRNGVLSGATSQHLVFGPKTVVNFENYGYLYIYTITLELQGTTTVSSQYVRAGNNARIVNSGNLRMTTTSTNMYCGGSCNGAFVNDGTVTVDMAYSSNTAGLQLAVSGAGSWHIERGILQLSAGGTLEGSVTVAEAAQVYVVLTSLHLAEDASITGKGIVSAGRATFSLAGRVAVNHLRVQYYGTIHLTTTAVCEPFESVAMGYSSYDMTLRVETAASFGSVRITSGKLEIMTPRVEIRDQFHLSSYGQVVSRVPDAVLAVGSWYWAGGYATIASGASLRVVSQEPMVFTGSGYFYVRGGLLEVSAPTVDSGYTSRFDLNSGGRLHILAGTEWVCRTHCDFLYGQMTIAANATLTVTAPPATESSYLHADLTLLGKLRSTGGRIVLGGAANIRGTVSMENNAVLDVSSGSEAVFAAESNVTLATLFIGTHYNSKTVRIESAQLLMQKLHCSSSYYSRQVIFAEGVALSGLKSIDDPSGRCDITLPAGDLFLDSASIGNSLRLGSASSTLHATDLVLRGYIRGPGTVTADSLSWLSGGFDAVNVTLGRTAIFSSDIRLNTGARVVLTQDVTVRSTSTSISIYISGGSLLHVPHGVKLLASSDVYFQGGADDTLLNEGTIHMARADSSNGVYCRFRNLGNFVVAPAAYVLVFQMEVEGAGHVLLNSVTTRMRFDNRKSTLAGTARLEGGVLEMYSDGWFEAPADRIQVESVDVLSGGRFSVGPRSKAAAQGDGSAAGISFSKRLSLTGGNMDLAAQVVLPTFVISSTSSELFVSPTGNLLVALNFAWQAGYLRAAEGQAAVKVDGELIMSSSSTKYLNGLSMQVQGTVGWTQGGVHVYNGANIHVLRGGTFLLMATSTMSSAGNGHVLIDGNLNVTVCGAEARISAPLNVTGIVTVRGALRLNSGGSLGPDAQMLLASDGAILRIAGGLFSASSLAGVTGATGYVEVTGGHLVALGGNLTVPLSLSSGQLEAGQGSIVLKRGVLWSNGDVRNGNGVIKVRGESIWSGGSMRGSLVWEGSVTVSSTSIKYVYGAMTVSTSGTMRHVQGDIGVSGNGNLVVQHGGLLVGEPQGTTRVTAGTSRFINLGTISVVSVAEPYQMQGLANYGRLIALRGEARLLSTAIFGPSSDVKGTGNVTVTSTLVLGGRVNLRAPGLLKCDGCALQVREPTWLGGNVWGSGVNVGFDEGYCPEASAFGSADLLRPPCPEAVLTLEGTVDLDCTSRCYVRDGVRITNNGALTVTNGQMQLSAVVENRGVMTLRGASLYSLSYSYRPSVVNEVGGFFVLQALESGSTVETAQIVMPVTNAGGVLIVEGPKRAYIDCLVQMAGKMVIDVVDGLRATTSSACGTIQVLGGSISGKGKLLRPLTCVDCTIQPGPGSLTVDGAVLMTNATLVTALRSPTLGDMLVATGALSLTGLMRLEVPVLDSYLAMGLRDSRFEAATFDSLVDDFDTFAAPAGLTANFTALPDSYLVQLQVDAQL